MGDNYEFIAHLRVEHGWTWKRLKSQFWNWTYPITAAEWRERVEVAIDKMYGSGEVTDG